MMMAVVATLDPSKDRRGLSPVERDTRLAAGACHFKGSACRVNGGTFLPCSRDSGSLRHFLYRVLEIWLLVQGVFDPSRTNFDFHLGLY